jgi:Rhs element Vgr protein
MSVVVDKAVNQVASASIVVDSGPSKQPFDVSNKPDFEPGKEIEIKAGYRGAEETIFKGIVIRHGIQVTNNSSLLVVECCDKAVKATVSCKSKYFRNMRDSDVMEAILDAYGIDRAVSSTTIMHKHLVQYNSTDWDFILCRADANGLLCTTDNGKIMIAKPNFSAAPKLTIQYGTTVRELDAEIDARLQYKSVRGTSWRYTDQQLLDTTEAENPSIPEAGNLTAAALANVINEPEFRLFHSGQMDEPELQAWVNAKMLRHRLAKVRGKVRTDGTAKVAPGDLLQLDGIGERFQGKLFVTGVKHRIEKGAWQTSFHFGVEPSWFAQKHNVQQPIAGALLPGIQGLQIGVVTQLKNDPEEEDRIQLRIPVIHKADEGIWCRVSTLDAGNNRGTFFRPEIGDEVIVGFVNNDPRHGIVLGMLHSSAKPAPLKASDENHEKGYVSRSGMKLMFNDDEKTIRIDTPGGNTLMLNEAGKKIQIEDQNGNKIILSADGINIESIKDLTLKAANDIKAEGNSINVKGIGRTKIEGSAGAELSSGGNTVVKGSTVMLN